MTEPYTIPPNGVCIWVLDQIRAGKLSDEERRALLDALDAVPRSEHNRECNDLTTAYVDRIKELDSRARDLRERADRAKAEQGRLAERLDKLVARLFRRAVKAEHQRRREETRETGRSQESLNALTERAQTGHVRTRREVLDDSVQNANRQRALAEARVRARTFRTCYAEAAALDNDTAARHVANTADAEEVAALTERERHALAGLDGEDRP